MRTNQTKQKLQNGEIAVGIFTLSADPHVTGVIAATGFDFVIYDLEHTSLTFERLEWLVRTADACGITPMVRVASGEKRDLLPALECGVQGVMVPVVETEAQAREAVRHARYFPEGQRGMYYLGYPSGYAGLSVRDHFASANRELLLIAQIETAQGVENAAAIAAVPGIDVVFVGPADLSQSLGIPGEWDDPRLLAAVERVLGAAAAAGKCAGVLPTNPTRAAEWAAAGARFQTWNQEMTIFKQALAQEAERIERTLGWRRRVVP